MNKAIFECVAIPKGWEELFKKEYDEIAAIAEKHHMTSEVDIIDVKEKYGSLRTTFITPASIYDEISKVVKNYEELSKVTCVICGKAPITTYLDAYYPIIICDECKEHQY